MRRLGDFIWITILLLVSVLMLSPLTSPYFHSLNETAPYILGFGKFAVLATMGEFLAVRIGENQWKPMKGLYQKMLVWGLIGVVITFMFKLFPIGIQGMIDKSLLISAEGTLGKVLFAIYNSIVANFAFGPIFMAAHRVSDTWIDAKVDRKHMKFSEILDRIDWPDFIQLVIGKMIPRFWLPAHFITFLLPEAYRILFAAYLSIILGVFMAIAKKGGTYGKRLS